MTQGRRIIEALKTRPMTYLEMNMLGISVCPWRRVAESLRPNEKLIKTKAGNVTRWKVKEVRLDRT